MAKEKQEKKSVEKKNKGPSQQELVAAEMKRLGDKFSTKDCAEKLKIPYANVAWYKWNLTANDGVRPPRDNTAKPIKKSKK